MSGDDDCRDLVVIEDASELIVVDTDVEVVRVDDEQFIVIADCGTQGPPGPPGPPGGLWYVHTQSTPSSAWVVNHNLGRLSQVTVFVPDFVEVEADVVQNTVNQVAITFATPQSGTALIG